MNLDRKMVKDGLIFAGLFIILIGLGTGFLWMVNHFCGGN